ncbi:MAG TPA: hypothetical protein VGM39_16005 [Kofleriaceae bacterium]
MSRLALVAGVVGALAGCAPDFDDTRVSADPGTFGERVVTLMCKRLAYSADPTDVSGDTYRATCKGGDVPPDAPATIVAISAQRARLVAAIDSIVPADQLDALQAYLTSDAVLSLYDDDTMSTSIASLGDMLGEMSRDHDAMSALARQGARDGYRPANNAVGPSGPLTGSPYIRELLSNLLPTIIADGNSKAAWDSVVLAISETLRDAKAPDDAGSDTRAARIGQTFLLTPYAELAETTAVPMVHRDPRGIAQVEMVGNLMPTPFSDTNDDGEPDVNADGYFVDSSGNLIDVPSPFTTRGDTAMRDEQGRAVDSAGHPVYDYFSVDQTLLGALALDQKQLIGAEKGTALDLVRGSSILLGDRVQKTKTFEDSGRTLDYQGYDTANGAPLLDLSYAFASLLRDPQTNETLDLGVTMFRDHEDMTSRLLEAAITTARMGDAHPEADIAADASLWDDLIPLVHRITADPVLVRNLIKAMAKPEVKQVITRFREFMQYKDRFDIDSSSNLVGALTTMPDRTMPDSGYNRSLFERLLAVISDTNGSVECSKAGAVLKEPNTGLVLKTFANACDFYQIPNMAIFYLQTMVWAKDANGNIICESTSGEFGSTQTKPTAEECPSIGTGWHARTKADFGFQWPALIKPLISVQGGDKYLADQAGITGFGTHPSTKALNRALFLRPRPDSLNDLSDPQMDKFGRVLTDVHSGTLPVWEINDFYTEMRPVLQAFADADQEATFVDIMSVLHKHWSSIASTDTQHTNPSAPNYTSGGHAVTWEPLLIDAFAGDLWPALTDHAAELDAIVIDGKPAATVLAHIGEYMTAPQAGLADRLGRTTTKTSDGRDVTTLSPFYLLADAENAKRARLAAAAGASSWTDSIPELWDLWFRGEKLPDGTYQFKCRHASAVIRGAIDLIRGRIVEHDTAGDRLAWLSTTLPGKVESTFTSPLFASIADFVEAQTQAGTRASLEHLLADVLDSANPDVFNTMRVGAADLLQLATDDADLVPLAHMAGNLLASDKNYLPTQLDLLSRLHQADVDATLTGIVARLFKPHDPAAPGIPAVSALIDGLGEVDRVTPTSTAPPWGDGDYVSVFSNVSTFMTEEQRGLPRFILIVKGRAE